jgi:hypothetical protein
MDAPARQMKYRLALNSIAARYCTRAMLHGYRTDWATAFLSPGDSASDADGARLAGVKVYSEELPMTTWSKTLLAAAALAAMATSAFSQVPWEFNPGMAYMYSGLGKMTAMAMAAGDKNHVAMMKRAKKVPANTIFFMDGGQMYMVSGTLDPTGNFYRP